MCHAFDQDAKDGHDLLVGLSSGDGNVFDMKLHLSFDWKFKLFKFFFFCVSL